MISSPSWISNHLLFGSPRKCTKSSKWIPPQVSVQFFQYLLIMPRAISCLYQGSNPGLWTNLTLKTEISLSKGSLTTKKKLEVCFQSLLNSYFAEGREAWKAIFLMVMDYIFRNLFNGRKCSWGEQEERVHGLLQSDPYRCHQCHPRPHKLHSTQEKPTTNVHVYTPELQLSCWRQ